jgi:hypothetical protein
VPLISLAEKPPKGATGSVTKNGRVYHHDRHNVIIAVAEPSERQQNQSGRTDETLSQMTSLQLTDDRQEDNRSKRHKTPGKTIPPPNNPLRTQDQPDVLDKDNVENNYMTANPESTRHHPRRSSMSHTNTLAPISEQEVRPNEKRIRGRGKTREGDKEDLDPRMSIPLDKASDLTPYLQVILYATAASTERVV